MKRNKFSLSHYKLLTGDMGYLIPLTWFETLPGDTIQHSTSLLIRVSPLLSPVMHPVRVRVHHWFVPNRIIWDDWEDFITGGEDGTNASTPPYRSDAAVTESNLADYLGIPPASYSPNLEWGVLALRAYQMIWNEFYRDQQLQTEATIDLTDGSDSTTSETLQQVSWEKDYFTTARTSELLGSAVTIPLTGDANVYGENIDFDDVDDAANRIQILDQAGASGTLKALTTAGGAGDHLYGKSSTSGSGKLKVDMEAVSSVGINDLRLALATQRYQEARNIYGARYAEYLRYCGVNPTKGRLKEPEYLGGGRQTIQFSEVLATADSGTYDVGDMLGHGISAMRTPRYRRFFEEHGIVMSLMSVIPKTIYTQGLHKKFSRTAKEDYFQKEFQHIGEDTVLNKEVYTSHTTPDGTFGYQARYDEYRSHPSSIAGEFHSSLDHWHYGRIFAADPSLNSTFITASPTKRVNQSAGTDCLYVMANHSIQARRLMAKRAVNRTF